MGLTEEQKKAAYTPNSGVVTAGAGTGKTFMLAERYLYYIRDCNLSPLEIVAVTFTEKAAAEMRSRIRALIREKLPNRSDILAELEAAQISTIHSLASRICREHFEVATVSPDFRVLDDIEGKLWQEECLETGLAKLPVQFYEVIPYSLLLEVLTKLLDDPWTAQKALKQGVQNWENVARKAREEALEKLINSPDWQEIKQVLQENSGKSGDKLEDIRQQVLEAINFLEQGQNISQSLTAINQALRHNCGSAKVWGKERLDLVKNSIKKLKNELVRPCLEKGLITLEVSEVDEQLKQMLPALQEAYQDVYNSIQTAKKEARVLTFADLEVYALQAVQNPQVQAYYQQRWKVFLVDEFQDTNPTQAEFLEDLTQKCQLTIVGDQKQSIYGFRRADVRVFDQFRDRILNENGTESILDQSFRTHASLIQDINRIFARILTPLHQNLNANRLDSPSVYPHIQAFTVNAAESNEIGDSQRMEAYHIAEMIQQMLNDQIPVWDKQKQCLRPIEAGDIAILTRTWKPLETYGEALAAKEIPVALAGGGSLLETREAKDAWALLRFLADPSDDIAFVAVLRSPFFAISDRLLFQYAPKTEKKPSSTWWQRLKIEPDFAFPVKVLQKLLAKRYEESPSRLLQIADHLTGYTATLANLPGAQRREADWQGFRELVKQLEQGTDDVFGVVRRLKRLVDAEVQIPRLPLEGRDAVSLMTIFAAKGLEWSVVVVADLSRKPGKNQHSTIYFDANAGVALRWKNAIGEQQEPVLYRWLKSVSKQQEEEEALRILYVALTRARDYLILTAKQEKGGDCDRLRPGLEAANIPIQRIPFETEKALPPSLPLPPIDWTIPPLLLNTGGSGLFELPVTALSEYARCPKRFQFHFVDGHPGLGESVTKGRQVGTLVHTALEKDIKESETLAYFADSSWGMEVIEEAIALSQLFYQNPIYAPFRENYVSKETPISLKVGSIRFNGVVDLVGNDWILDYKTDQEQHPEHHRFQCWAYATALDFEQAYIAYLRHDNLHRFTVSKIQETHAEAQILVERLEKGYYTASPSLENCFGCPYEQICEYSCEHSA